MPRRSRFETERERVLAAIRAGATEAYACAGLTPPIALRTLANWKTANPAFAAELKEAKAVPDGMVQHALFRSASGRVVSKRKPVVNRTTGQVVLGPVGEIVYEEEYFPPNVIAQIFWLKNRQPDDWKDRREFEQSDKPILVEIVERSSDDEPTGFRGE